MKLCKCGQPVRITPRIVYAMVGGERKKYTYPANECNKCRADYERKRSKLRVKLTAY